MLKYFLLTFSFGNTKQMVTRASTGKDMFGKLFLLAELLLRYNSTSFHTKINT